MECAAASGAMRMGKVRATLQRTPDHFRNPLLVYFKPVGNVLLRLTGEPSCIINELLPCEAQSPCHSPYIHSPPIPNYTDFSVTYFLLVTCAKPAVETHQRVLGHQV